MSGDWDEQQEISRCIVYPSRLQRPESDRGRRYKPWNALATNFQSIDNLGSFRRTVYYIIMFFKLYFIL